LRLELPQAPQRDLDALVAELGLMGTAGRPALENGRHVFTLDTAESEEDILAICSFVLDPEQLKISEQGQAPVPVPALVSGPAPASEALAPRPAAAAGSREEKAVPAHESASIRVGIDKVDQLINLVGELVITQAMIAQRTDTLDPMLHERLLSSVSQLNRNTRDLQEAVMAIRMMPMDYVFSRFPRMVRDLAAKLGKKVDFVTHGAATELDKGLIERIVDPLTHLVRNSVDHGLELPAVRVAAGKGESGTLALSAQHQGGNIVIEVSDDGGGLDREKILAKARQQGLPVSDGMPDAEVWRLIFAPGFSTAEAVTDVSGRGVGMDVVRRNISAMGGAVDVRSVAGQGTTITISLPLTLAILDGMSVRVGDEVYIVPLGYVVESLQPAAADVKNVAGSGQVLKVRGEYLPLIRLGQAFGINARYTDPAHGIVVILETEGRKAALLVDELVGQQQVVVKNLEANYRKVPGISGATIMGDGGVALILDVAGLLRSGGALRGEARAA
jgi:two-component system chemotaxis sensor kinase CheA